MKLVFLTFYFLAILALPSLTTASALNCNKGCLRCIQTNATTTTTSNRILSTNLETASNERFLEDAATPVFKCLVCDTALGFHLAVDVCIQRTMPDCEMASPLGDKCYICLTGNSWNVGFKKCAPVPTSKLIANCHTYNEALGCIRCKPNFLYDVGSKKCNPVTTQITGCVTYKDLKNCALCEGDYYLDMPNTTGSTMTCKKNPVAEITPADSTDTTTSTTTSTSTDTTDGTSTTSVEPPAVDCKLRSSFKCSRCKTNFFLDYNYQHKLDYSVMKHSAQMIASDFRLKFGIYNTTPLLDFLTTEVKTELNSVQLDDLGLYNPCIGAVVENCTTYKAFDACQVCNDKYYLETDGTCKPQPAPPIAQCVQYESEEKCSLCDNSYYLGSNGTVCLKVTEVANCKTYQGVSNKCSECNAQTLYANQGTNTCSTRSNHPIENCSIYSLTEDKCMTCETGKLITSTKTKCLPIPSSCIAYTENGATVTCTSCDMKYFLSGNACTIGTVASCKDYDQTKVNTCVNCDYKFFLNVSKTCTNFSKSVDKDCSGTGKGDNECRECINKQFPLLRHKRCVQISNSSAGVGCAVYNSQGACTQCKNGFFGLSCQFENQDASIGCTKFNNNSDDIAQTQCILCQRETHYIKDNKCEKRNSLSIKNCNISQVDSEECQFCNTDTAPRHALKIGTCVLKTTLALTSNVLDNCDVFDYDTQKCQVCKSPFYLSLEVCVSSCPSDKLAVEGIYSAIDSEDVYHGRQCVSKPSYLNNCQTVKVQPPKNLICTACKTGYKFGYDMFSGNSLTAGVNIHHFDITADKFDGKESFTSFGCVSETEPIAKNSSDAELFVKADCQIFSINNGYLYCSRCINGKVGIVQKDKYTNLTLGACTAKDTEFDSAIRYKSTSYSLSARANPPLAHSLDSLFSVHKCKTAGKIVFAITKLKTTSTTSKLTLTVSDTSKKPAAQSSSISNTFNQFCDDVSKLGADLANCLLGVLDADNTTDDRLFCVACKPGYRAEQFQTNGVYIKKCVAITDCADTSASLSAGTCASCTHSAWRYSATKAQVLFDQCAPAVITDCLLIDSVVSKCAVCKKGFFLSLEKTKCLAQTEESCQSPGSDFLFNVDGSLYPNTFPSTLGYISEQLGQGRGCETCSSGHVKVVYNRFMCESNSNLITHTILNCTKPMVDSGLLTCIQCGTGYIPRENTSECVAASIDTAYLNCDLLEKTTTNIRSSDNMPIYPCKICDSKYLYSVRNKCDVLKIANCDEQDKDTGKCLKCSENFALSFDECVAIPNDQLCVKFDNNNNCSQCKAGYELMLIEKAQVGGGSATASECIVTDFLNNCKSGKNLIYFDAGKQSYVEKCEECLDGYTLVDKDGTEYGETFSTCYPTPYPDDNCEKYDLKSLMCSTCKTNYYVITNNLINKCQGIVPVANCTTYAPNTNICTGCETDYFINTSTATCIKNPTGVKNCKRYLDKIQCDICVDKFYLVGNECMAVAEDKLISKCDVYAGSSSCKTCSEGYLPMANNTSCEQIKEVSCLTWTDINNCATCPDGKTLQTEDNAKKCKVVSITNCSKVDTLEVKCLKCNSNHFYDTATKACIAVKTTVSNCDVYESVDYCKECKSNYMLSATKQTCQAFSAVSNLPIDNCDVGLEVAPKAGSSQLGYCVQCNEGFYKKAEEDTCSACEIQDCRFCDVAEGKKCHVCRTGYFMTSDGKCGNSITGEVPGDDEVVAPAPTPTTSVKIIGTLWILILVSLGLLN